MDGGDLAILGDESVTLGSVLAEDGSGLEEEVQFLGEFTVWVSEEADSALGSGVEGLGPGAHHWEGVSGA